jgi:nucleotide-binding universal stress UspA family protein
MSEIIIGVDGTERGEDAVAFGRRLAAFAGARLVLANAFPYDDIRGRATSLAYREALRADSQTMLDAVRHRSGLDASTHPIAGTSPARALHELAEHDGAAMVVVGSSHAGRARRALPGTTGERLLHGSPCAVAVVPKGYRETEHEAPRRIGVGTDGGDEATEALRGAAELARALGAELEVIWAFAPKVARVDDEFLADLERTSRARVDETVKALPPAIEAARVFVESDPVDTLVQRSRELDLLVIGSRGYGPLRSVLLGGVSGRVIRDAACPVIVVPRGAQIPLEALLSRAEVSPEAPAAR